MERLIRAASVSIGMILGMAIVLSACEAQSTVGNQNNNQNPWNGVNCTIPYVELAGRCAYGLTFADRCRSVYGSIVSGASGEEVCRVSVDYASMLPWISTFPSLHSGNSNTAYRPNVAVEAGDQISITARGSWGGYKVSDGKFLGIKVTKWKLDCSQVDLNGVSLEDNEELTSGEHPSGLMLSIVGLGGSTTTFVGTGADIVAAGAGYLRLGINTPPFNGACLNSDFRITRLKVTHCETASGKSVSCL